MSNKKCKWIMEGRCFEPYHGEDGDDIDIATFYTDCMSRFSMLDSEGYNYKYCPCCGKEIVWEV